MRANALHRLTGQMEPLPEFSLAGLWASQQDGLLNGLPVEAGTLLLPDARGLMTWVSQGEDPITATLPNPEGSGIRLGSLEAALTGLGLEKGNWDDWLNVSPMDSDLERDLHRFPLEESMSQELSHLEAVYQQPRTHLEIYEERQLVSRARQIPVRAVNYLASHTEDWEARTLRGVRPRRVIANVRDDRYDIYENRVAVRLVDHLTRYVRRRLARIKELIHSLQTIDLNAQEPPTGMHWRQQRIYCLWGEALDVTAAQLLASERLEELERFLYRLERLRTSLLYGNVPAKAQVSPQLRITNILGNDPHYRRVARLWLSWFHHAHTGHLSLQEQQKSAQEEAKLFDRYVRLLLIHALDQFEFVPVGGRELRECEPIQLSGPEGNLTLLCHLDGSTSLLRGNREVLRVVGSPTPLIEIRRDEVNGAVIALQTEARTLSCQAVLLYPGNANMQELAAFHSVSGDPGNLNPQLSCLPVSPVDLESVERLARALRWALTGERFKAYPPGFESRVVLPKEERPTGLQEQGRGQLYLLRPISRIPETWARETERRQQLLVDAQQELRKVGTSKPLYVRQVQRKIAERQAELMEWNTFISKVGDAEANLLNLQRCPVCGTEHADFSAWEDGQFNCECEDCGAQWSLRRCQDCGNYHPWLLPHLREVPAIPIRPGWADQLYGRDVLTLPDPSDPTSFSCPSLPASELTSLSSPI